MVNPLSHFYKYPPDYSFLRVLDASFFLSFDLINSHKFSLRSILCCFLGYRNDHLGFFCYDRKSYKIYVVRHCKFIEENFYFSQSTMFSPIVSNPIDILNWHNPSLSTSSSGQHPTHPACDDVTPRNLPNLIASLPDSGPRVYTRRRPGDPPIKLFLLPTPLAESSMLSSPSSSSDSQFLLSRSSLVSPITSLIAYSVEPSIAAVLGSSSPDNPTTVSTSMVLRTKVNC